MTSEINYAIPEYKKDILLWSRFVSETRPEEFFSMDTYAKLVTSLRISYGVKVMCILLENPKGANYRLHVYYTLPEMIYGKETPKEVLFASHPNVVKKLENRIKLPMKLYDFNRDTHVNGSIKTVREYELRYYNTDLWDIILFDTYTEVRDLNFTEIKIRETEFNQRNKQKNIEWKNSPEYRAEQDRLFQERCRRRDQKALAEANAAEVHC